MQWGRLPPPPPPPPPPDPPPPPEPPDPPDPSPPKDKKGEEGEKREVAKTTERLEERLLRLSDVAGFEMHDEQNASVAMEDGRTFNVIALSSLLVVVNEKGEAVAVIDVDEGWQGSGPVMEPDAELAEAGDGTVTRLCTQSAQLSAPQALIESDGEEGPQVEPVDTSIKAWCREGEGSPWTALVLVAGWPLLKAEAENESDLEFLSELAILVSDDFTKVSVSGLPEGKNATLQLPGSGNQRELESYWASTEGALGRIFSNISRDQSEALPWQEPSKTALGLLSESPPDDGVSGELTSIRIENFAGGEIHLIAVRDEKSEGSRQRPNG